MAEKSKATIVEAVGTAVSAPRAGLALAKRLEAAMVAETEACAADGIIDPDIIRERKLVAYEAEKAVAREEAATARREEAERLAGLDNAEKASVVEE